MAEENAIKINSKLLLQRLNALQKHLTENAPLYGDVTALQLVHGKQSLADEPMVVSMQMHLLGYEFPDTIALLVNNTFHVFASTKKLDYLREAETMSAAGGVRVQLHAREKGDIAGVAAVTASLITAAKDAGARLGGLPAEPVEGPIGQAWLAEVEKAGIVLVDIFRALEAYLAVKDEAALAELRAAGVLTARAQRQVAQKAFEDVIDDEKSVTNAGLQDIIRGILEDRAALEKKKVPVDTDNFEAVMPPLVQSGGAYNIHIAGQKESTTKAFSPDVIIQSLGMRYKSQRAVVARTYLVDPTKRMAAIYDGVLAAHETLIASLTPGTPIKDVVQAARDKLLKTENMPMSAKMTKNFGSGVGPRLADRFCVLAAKNEAKVEVGMSFTVQMGLSDIPMEDKHPVASAAVNSLESYAILLADTVIITPAGPVVITDKASRARKDIAYEMAGAEEEEEEEEEEEDGGDAAAAARKEARRRERSSRGAVAIDEDAGRDAYGRSARLREKAAAVDPEAAKKREEHQQVLLEKKVAAAKRKAEGGGGSDEDDDEEAALARAPDILAYRSTAEYVRPPRPNQIMLDKAHDCVLLPILGTLVPFHISTIKSVSKSEEGHKSFLRFNLYSAGQSLGKDVPPSMAAAVMRHPELLYIRQLSFMSRDGRNFVDVEQKIKGMLKKYKQERKEEAESANLVEQAKLIPRRDGKAQIMRDTSMWPNISGRSTTGDLTIHMNGLQFRSSKGEVVDIIFANIKQAIFIPCEGEHLVLIHFHLRHPILIGKKKQKDIQFFTEAVESSMSLEGRGRSDFDPDELGDEEKQNKFRADLNRAYRSFVLKVQEAARSDANVELSFDIPPRDYSFAGTPFKEMTNVYLGASCIAAVVDKPPMVVTINDIEHVHFERVFHGTKSFDMVVIFKPGVAEKGQSEYYRISSVEVKYLDMVKEWLDELAEITFTEGAMSLNWDALIAEFVRAPEFYLTEDPETGESKKPGFAVFLPDSDEEGEEEEEDDEYESDEEEDEEEEDEDDDDDESYASEDESDDDYDEEDEDEEGEDWEELERKAAEEDKRRKYDDDDDEDDRRAKKKSSSSGGSGGSSKAKAGEPPKKKAKY